MAEAMRRTLRIFTENYFRTAIGLTANIDIISLAA